jgi:hypothetical protein
MHRSQYILLGESLTKRINVLNKYKFKREKYIKDTIGIRVGLENLGLSFKKIKNRGKS